MNGMDLADLRHFKQPFHHPVVLSGPDADQYKGRDPVFHLRQFDLLDIGHFSSERLHIFRDELVDPDAVGSLATLLPLMKRDVGIKIRSGSFGKGIGQMAFPDNSCQRAVDGLVPVDGGIPERHPLGVLGLEESVMFGDLLDQVGVLADLRQIDGFLQTGFIPEFAFFPVKQIFEAVFGGQKFDDMGIDAVVAVLLCGRHAVIAVQDVIFVLDLVEFDRRQHLSLEHQGFDLPEPV